MIVICPRCKSTRVRPQTGTWLYRCAGVVGLRTYRCRFCLKYFFSRHRNTPEPNAPPPVESDVEHKEEQSGSGIR